MQTGIKAFLIFLTIFVFVKAESQKDGICDCLYYSKEEMAEFKTAELYAMIESCGEKIDDLDLALNIKKTELYKNLSLSLDSSDRFFVEIEDEIFNINKAYLEEEKRTGTERCDLFVEKYSNDMMLKTAVILGCAGSAVFIIGMSCRDIESPLWEGPALWPYFSSLVGAIVTGVSIPLGSAALIRHTIKKDKKLFFISQMRSKCANSLPDQNPNIKVIIPRRQ